MFFQNKLARTLGALMAIVPFGAFFRNSVADVLAENPCVNYNSFASTADCTLYYFAGCDNNCIHTSEAYQITGSTDPRDFQRNCINVRDDSGTGFYSDAWGSVYNGSDEAGYYTMNVSGCLMDDPLTTGRYGRESCELGSCDERNWSQFRSCLADMGCLLADQYTGADCFQDWWQIEYCGFMTGIICSRDYDNKCTIYDMMTGDCVPSSAVSRTASETHSMIQEKCGDIQTPAGTYNGNHSIENVYECGTGYIM